MKQYNLCVLGYLCPELKRTFWHYGINYHQFKAPFSKQDFEYIVSTYDDMLFTEIEEDYYELFKICAPSKNILFRNVFSDREKGIVNVFQEFPETKGILMNFDAHWWAGRYGYNIIDQIYAKSLTINSIEVEKVFPCNTPKDELCFWLTEYVHRLLLMEKSDKSSYDICISEGANFAEGKINNPSLSYKIKILTKDFVDRPILKIISNASNGKNYAYYNDYNGMNYVTDDAILGRLARANHTDFYERWEVVITEFYQKIYDGK